MKKDVRRLTAKARRRMKKGDEMETEGVKKMNAPKKILIINGPNLNMLGIREPDLYGAVTHEKLVGLLANWCREEGVGHDYFQSNHEGAIVDRIQEAYFEGVDGIVMNPAAYTHTSVAILDALKATAIPTVEIHITDVSTREDFRRVSYVALAAKHRIMGHGIEGYREAIGWLVDYLNKA